MVGGGEGRATVTFLGGGEAVGDPERQMAEDVKAGLTSTPKDLSPWPKYLYDANGSEIFEEITALPEYYQTRTELSILQREAPKMVARTGCRELIELGSGSASKTRALLDAVTADANGEPVRYVPFDVSESALRGSAERLLGEYPEMEIHGYVGDFDLSLEELLSRPSPDGAARLVAFLGGTVGNFTPEARTSFLRRLGSGMRAGDRLLVGMDLVKDARILERAYDDAAGVTARFNKNLLNVLNDKLDAKFDPELFVHRSVYDAKKERVEMWLHSQVAQKVRIAALGLSVPFEEGEGMRTEISSKFTRASAAAAFEAAGLRLVELYTDDDGLFGLALVAP